jgi:excisionase family DNA binding protein
MTCRSRTAVPAAACVGGLVQAARSLSEIELTALFLRAEVILHAKEHMMTDPATERLLTRRQVAELMSVSERMVSRLVKRGVLPAPLRIGRAVRWRESEVLDAIRQLPQSSAHLPQTGEVS